MNYILMIEPEALARARFLLRRFGPYQMAEYAQYIGLPIECALYILRSRQNVGIIDNYYCFMGVWCFDFNRRIENEY